jgi:hypothetical protein
LAKAQKTPAYAGAAAAKIADALNRSGIINEEYANDVNRFLHDSGKQQQETAPQPINWDVAPQPTQ